MKPVLTCMRTEKPKRATTMVKPVLMRSVGKPGLVMGLKFTYGSEG